MKIVTARRVDRTFSAEVRQHWQGVVFPHVEYLDRWDDFIKLEIPIEFWRELLLNVNKISLK